jgi:hypothetical protein
VPLPKLTTYTSHSFFSGQPAVAANKSLKAPVFVNVGGNADCGFRSVAAGFVDNFLADLRMSTDLLNKVLTAHFKYFPAHRTTLPGLITPAERMQQLIKDVRMAELLPALAYTFRQLAVTEMCSHPERYRGAFVDRNEGTAPAEMRKATTWIDEVSILALAHVLEMPIQVQVVEHAKPLPLNLEYNADAKEPAVVIKLQGNHYIPGVKAADRFNVTATKAPRVNESVIHVDPDLATIYAAIKAADQQMISLFEDTHHRLSTMALAGELSKSDLLAMYVNGMANSDYLRGRIACVGIEHGNQDFFNAVMNTKSGTSKDVLPTTKHDDRIVAELIHAIARAVSIGQMSEEAVFAHVDGDKPASVALN